MLADVADVLSATSDIETVLHGIASAALRGLADHALVERYGRAPRRVILRARRERPTQAWDLAAEADEDEALAQCARRAASTGELDREEGDRPRVGVPITDESGVIGALALAPGDVALDADELALVREIARRAGIALRSARLHESLESSERALRALEHVDRRKDELIALLGHELRGPLAAIAGALEVLDRFATEDSRVARAREVVRRQVATGTRLAEDLLDSSRIAQGKMTLRLESLDLAALVADVVEDHRSVAAHHGLALRLEGLASPIRVHGDRTRLAQALGNVLHNAIKFSHPGGTIAVRVASDGARASVVVLDDGVGIPPDLLDRVFEPFAQAEVDPHRAGAGGLGLGLALVRGVLELHGGRAEARSEGRDRGTELRLELPVDARERTRTSSVPPPSTAAPVSVRVLVVEDDRDAAEMLQILLESEGHAVDIAANGPAALAAAERDAPDLVLCDLGLPGAMSGIEVACALRSLPGVSAVYLVALSGFGDDEARERAVRAGFDRHLTKPAELARLRECAALAAARRAPVHY